MKSAEIGSNRQTRNTSDLAYALNPNAITGSIVDYQKSLQKGPKVLDAIIRDLRMAEHRLMRAADSLRKLSVCFPTSDIRPEDPNMIHRNMLREALVSVNVLCHGYERSAKMYRVRTLDPPDKRRVRDERRGFVLAQIFQFWSDQGRSLTVTTDSVTSERRGPLVDFTNAVVTCVTDPPQKLHGETIWAELEPWRKFIALRESVSIADLISDQDT